MSRRQLTLVVVTLVSIAAAACGTASTAPQHDTNAPVRDTTAIVTNGSGG